MRILKLWPLSTDLDHKRPFDTLTMIFFNVSRQQQKHEKLLGMQT